MKVLLIKVARRILQKIRPLSVLEPRAIELSRQLAVLEERAKRSVGEQRWVYSTALSNLKEKVAKLEGRLERSGAVEDVRSAWKLRARDVEDYVRLGGRRPSQ